MTRPVLAVAGLSILLLGGCLPVPHRTQAVPALFGKVTRNGTPVQGAEIRVTYGLDRDKSVVVGPTDKSGSFAYPGKEDFHVFVFFGDPGFDWSLTLHASGQEYLGFSDRGLGYVPKTVRFNCDLSTPKGQPVCRSL